MYFVLKDKVDYHFKYLYSALYYMHYTMLLCRKDNNMEDSGRDSYVKKLRGISKKLCVAV